MEPLSRSLHESRSISLHHNSFFSLTIICTAPRFRERLDTASSDTARERFIDTFDHYLDATVREAENREDGTILGLADFMELRRGNSGVEVAFALIECILSIDLQPEVFDDPAFSRLRKLAGNMLFAANVSPSWIFIPQTGPETDD